MATNLAGNLLGLEESLAAASLASPVPKLGPPLNSLAEWVSEFASAQLELEDFHALKTVESLQAKLMEFKKAKDRAEALCDSAMEWINKEPRNVNKSDMVELASKRQELLKWTQDLSNKMSFAAEAGEIDSIFAAIEEALGQCDTGLDDLCQRAAAIKFNTAEQDSIQIPESASPQAPIRCPEDVTLNESLSRLRFQSKALRRSIQVIPLRLDNLELRARPNFELAYELLCSTYRRLDARISAFSHKFDALDQKLTHELWLPIIAHSKDPRVRNYAKIRGFCKLSPEKPMDGAIALFRGVKPPRRAISKSAIPVLLPTSPPSFSSASDSQTTVASLSETSEGEPDFFTTSPLQGKGWAGGGVLHIPRIRKPKLAKLHEPTEIITGQKAAPLRFKAPELKPRLHSRIQAPTPITVQTKAQHCPRRPNSRFELRYHNFASRIPTVRCSSICTK